MITIMIMIMTTMMKIMQMMMTIKASHLATKVDILSVRNQHDESNIMWR